MAQQQQQQHQQQQQMGQTNTTTAATTTAATTTTTTMTRHKKRKALPVTEGLRSEQTERQYNWHFGRFKTWLSEQKKEEITDDKLLEFEREDLERDVIDYLRFLRKGRHLKHSSINLSMASIFHFCKANDMWLHKERVSMFLPEDEDNNKDDARPYKRKEIQKVLKESDARFRVVFLLLANGLRVGAIPGIRRRDLTPWPLPTDDPKPPKVYQIKVYGRSKNHWYKTFVTPECATAIDDYAAFRKKHAREDFWANPEAPLIRDQFPLYNRRLIDNVEIPKAVSQSSLEKSIERIVKKAGLENINVPLTHGLRQWAISTMDEVGLRDSVRRYLTGHSQVGQDKHYVKPSDERKLFEWSKCINDLTIEDESYHLQKELRHYKDEYAKKISQLEQELYRQKAFYTSQMDQMRKEFLDHQDKVLQPFVDAHIKAEAAAKEST
jgi:hypothetical protein